MKTKKTKILTTIVFFISCGFTFSNELIHIVKTNETLSGILYKKKLGPIYGKSGNLKKILELNPQIKKSRGNKIYPGMAITLFEENKSSPSISDNLATTGAIPLINIPERTPSDDFKQEFYWKISPTLSWKNLSANDESTSQRSTIVATSDTNFGAELNYGMHFQEDLNIYSHLSVESVKFSEDSSIRLLKKQFITTAFGVGLFYKGNWLADLSISDQLFLTSPNSSSVEIQKVLLPQFKGAYLKDFYYYRNAKLAYSISGVALFPKTASTIKSKLGYGGGFSLEAKLHNQSFQIGYDKLFLKATNNSTDSQNIYWKYTWETL